jgi:5-methylcytosine-specific restriction endonuclease McrA
MKTCKKCKEIKQLTEFNRYKASKDGLFTICKSCVAIQNANYYNKNRENRLKYHKEYSQTEKGKASLRKGNLKHQKTPKGKASLKRYAQSSKGKASRAIIDKRHRQTPHGKAAHNAISAKYRAAKLQATPKGLTKEQLFEIKSFYVKAETSNCHVDHVLPLQGESICGLHVPWNLQILTGSENDSKGNKFDFTYENESWRSS